MASADFSLRWPHGHRRPFRRKARPPRVRPSAFAARPPDLRRLSLGHESFAVICPLALLGSASYPVPVRRPAASLPASFTPASRSNALRFASLAVTSSREDFHLQVDAHAGRTNKTRPALASRAGYVVSTASSPTYFASGSGRSWNFTSFGRSPLPMPSTWNGVRLPAVAQTPRPFQPPFGSSMRPSKVLA
jgi:hypothetical protein